MENIFDKENENQKCWKQWHSIRLVYWYVFVFVNANILKWNQFKFMQTAN